MQNGHNSVNCCPLGYHSLPIPVCCCCCVHESNFTTLPSFRHSLRFSFHSGIYFNPVTDESALYFASFVPYASSLLHKFLSYISHSIMFVTRYTIDDYRFYFLGKLFTFVFKTIKLFTYVILNIKDNF